MYVYTDTRRMALHVIDNNAPPLTRNEIAQVRNEGSSQPLHAGSNVARPKPRCHLLISSSLVIDTRDRSDVPYSRKVAPRRPRRDEARVI